MISSHRFFAYSTLPFACMVPEHAKSKAPTSIYS